MDELMDGSKVNNLELFSGKISKKSKGNPIVKTGSEDYCS